MALSTPASAPLALPSNPSGGAISVPVPAVAMTIADVAPVESVFSVIKAADNSPERTNSSPAAVMAVLFKDASAVARVVVSFSPISSSEANPPSTATLRL